MISVEMKSGASSFSLRAPNELHILLTEIGGSHFSPFNSVYTYPATVFCAQAVRTLASLQTIQLTANQPFTELLNRYDLIKPLRERTKEGVKLDQPTIRTVDSWDWQLQAYHVGLNLEAVMFWMGVGTGKSKTTIDLIQNAEHKKIVMGMPNHILKDSDCWDRQFELYAKGDYQLEVLDYGSTKANLERIMIQSRRMNGSKVPLIFAINYESVWRAGVGEALLAWKPDLLVLEESHKVKAPGGKASRYVARLAMKSKQRAALTGTMMFNSQLDAYGQYRALDPGIFGTSYSRFRDNYAVVYDHHGVPIIQGYKNQKQLASKIAPITVQIESKVLKLPEPIHDSRLFDLTPSERKVYDEIEQEYCTETEQGFLTVTNGLTKILRLQQLTGGWLPLREDNVEAQLKRIGKSKQELLRDLLDDIPKNEPVVVFARFIADLDSIKEVALELKRPYGEISGRAYDKQLWNDGAITVLGVQVQAGEGLDNLKKAQYGIFYSVGYSNGQFEQCVGRLRRPGMREFAYFYHLVARDTVDVAVYKALKMKQSIRDRVITYLKEHAKAA